MKASKRRMDEKRKYDEAWIVEVRNRSNENKDITPDVSGNLSNR